MYASVPITAAVAVDGEIAQVRDAEVREARDAGVVEQDVRGFHVAMENAEAVSFAERAQHGVGDFDGARGSER